MCLRSKDQDLKPNASSSRSVERSARTTPLRASTRLIGPWKLTFPELGYPTLALVGISSESGPDLERGVGTGHPCFCWSDACRRGDSNHKPTTLRQRDLRRGSFVTNGS
jgi:hypothetical protein